MYITHSMLTRQGVNVDLSGGQPKTTAFLELFIQEKNEQAAEGVLR